MTKSHTSITIIGAGLASCEAAWQAANRGIPVLLHEMKPEKYSPAALVKAFHHRDECWREWEQRDELAEWPQQWWFADAAAIHAGDFNLSASRYRPRNSVVFPCYSLHMNSNIHLNSGAPTSIPSSLSTSASRGLDAVPYGAVL